MSIFQSSTRLGAIVDDWADYIARGYIPAIMAAPALPWPQTGDNVQSTQYIAQIQSDIATITISRPPRDYSIAGDPLFDTSDLSPGGSWSRTLTDFGLLHNYFERRRPREVANFDSTEDTQGNTLAAGMVAWILNGTGSRSKDPMPLYTRESDGTWTHTPLATADELSNYSVRPNAVVDGVGDLYDDANYPKYPTGHAQEGQVNTEWGEATPGDYIGEWVLDQVEAAMPYVADQCQVYAVGSAAGTIYAQASLSGSDWTAVKTATLDWYGDDPIPGWEEFGAISALRQNSSGGKIAYLHRGALSFDISNNYAEAATGELFVLAIKAVESGGTIVTVANDFEAHGDGVTENAYANVHSEPLTAAAYGTGPSGSSTPTLTPTEWPADIDSNPPAWPATEPTAPTSGSNETKRGWRSGGTVVLVVRPPTP